MAKKGVKKGKKPHKNKPTSKKYTKYKIEGDKVTRERFCPRCGPGIFLMNAKDRVYCGKCHYSEFASKKETSPSDTELKKEE
ncbi:MAG TPA: 30S ribosomal protein S27ae [Candidatus Pacearchaeota archaeon]|nr:30S ribosomal protein S27ae [Candidatus Pacearchaeota archaeon]